MAEQAKWPEPTT